MQGEGTALKIQLLDDTRAEETCAEVRGSILSEAPELSDAVASGVIGFSVESAA